MQAEVVAVPAIDTWPVIVSLKATPWLVAVIKSAHLLGVAVLFGCTAAFDLRVLGWNNQAPVTTLSRHLLPLSLGSVVLIIPSGVLLFALEASRHLESSAFMIKLGLILAAAGLAIVFRSGPYRNVDSWNVDTASPAGAKALALASLLCWTGVLYCAALVGRAP